MPDDLALTMPRANGPALNSTNDMPQVVAPDPATEAPAEPASSPTSAGADRARGPDGKFLPLDNAQGETDTGQTAEPKAGEDKTAKAPKPDLTPPDEKAFMARMRAEARAAREQAARTQAQLDEAIAALKQAAEGPKKPDLKPQRADFTDPDAYDTALVDWSAKQARQAALTEAQQTRAREEIEGRRKSLLDNFSEAKAKFIADHDDYEDVAEADDLQITLPMSHAIMAAGDNGPAIAYHLGQHPEEAARIAKLGPIQAAVEIGKIDATLEAKPAPRAPRTPPLTPLGARNGAGPKDASQMTTEEYEASIAERLPYRLRSARTH